MMFRIQPSQPVVAQRDLLLLAPWVLDDRHELADDGLALGLDQRVASKSPQDVLAGADGDQGEVALLIGDKEGEALQALTCRPAFRARAPRR